MENQIEIWKDIQGYEGIYQISDLGLVKSLSRNILKSGKYSYKTKEKILKPSIDNDGYCVVTLSKNGIKKTRRNHLLVAESFLNHISNGMKLVVNHINFIKIDNSLKNLEIVTQRENANCKHIKSSSIYTGVSWTKANNKWKAAIYVNGKTKHLGYFIIELEAHYAYENKLLTLNTK